MTRDEAWALLCEHTKSESLRKHGLAVEAAMRRFARANGEDEETWAITGLLHDFDYERDPAGHPQKGKPILEQAGVPGAIVHAIQSHGDHTGVPRVTAMEKTLYAVDELCGFVTAVALVRFRRLTLRKPHRNEPTIRRRAEWLQWPANCRLQAMRSNWMAVSRSSLKPKREPGRALRS